MRRAAIIALAVGLVAACREEVSREILFTEPATYSQYCHYSGICNRYDFMKSEWRWGFSSVCPGQRDVRGVRVVAQVNYDDGTTETVVSYHRDAEGDPSEIYGECK